MLSRRHLDAAYRVVDTFYRNTLAVYAGVPPSVINFTQDQKAGAWIPRLETNAMGVVALQSELG